MEENQPNRAERRRQEKEAAQQKSALTCNQCEKGPCVIAPKTYDKCPVCGCPTTFTVMAMKGDMHLQENPALFSMEKIYATPSCNVKLVAVGASCARCGVFYTIAREKLKGLPLAVPKKPGDGGGLILP